MFKDEIGRLLRHEGVIDAIQASWALDEATDMMLGVYTRYDDVTTVRPFAVIALHPKEELYSGTLLDRWAGRFAEYEVGQTFGISLAEFLQMDVASATILYNISRQRMLAKLKQYDDMKKKTKEESGDKK